MPLFRIFSFHQGNLQPKALAAQRAIFAAKGIPLEQYYSPLTHGQAIDDCLRKNSWDAVALFDIDAFCRSRETISTLLQESLDVFGIYGGAHNANHRHGSADYASPACCVFSRQTWDRAGESFTTRADNDGRGFYDVGQKFSLAVAEAGGHVRTTPPVSVEEPCWNLADGSKFGIGTDYGWAYHQFNGCVNEKQNRFVDRCLQEADCGIFVP